jgi:hypothetical protein
MISFAINPIGVLLAIAVRRISPVESCGIP